MTPADKNRRLSDAVFTRVLRNMSWLFSAQIIIALLGLVTLAITARALGPAGLGILALVEAYIRIIDRLVRFEPWQAVIKFGATAPQDTNKHPFLRLVKLSILTDLAGGFLAGAIAISGALLITPLIGLPENGNWYIWFVSLSLFFSLRPTGVAVLRIFDRFDRLAKLDVAVAATRLLIAAGAYQLGLGIWAFLAILLVQSLADGILAFLVALQEMRKRGFHNIRAASARRAIAENPGFLRLLWNSNVNVILRQSAQRLDVILLGTLLDPAAIGFYQIAKRSANAALRLGRPLRQVIYPEIARLWANRQYDRFRLVVTRTSILVFFVSFASFIPLAIFMPRLVALFFGDAFVPAATLVTIQAFSVVVYLSGILLNPTLLSIGKDRALVWITLGATLAFFALFFPLVSQFGAIGAAISHVIFNLLWLFGCLFFLLGENRALTQRGRHSADKRSGRNKG